MCTRPQPQSRDPISPSASRFTHSVPFRTKMGRCLLPEPQCFWDFNLNQHNNLNGVHEVERLPSDLLSWAHASQLQIVSSHYNVSVFCVVGSSWSQIPPTTHKTTQTGSWAQTVWQSAASGDIRLPLAHGREERAPATSAQLQVQIQTTRRRCFWVEIPRPSG